ncbi:hypothetical protein BDZ45DRAFT_744056 [Acephala macrosclerotiorum]|nr:hypothetical protein BDZ45DRAFT_744056 [Acephala macrosclerotiorum]
MSLWRALPLIGVISLTTSSANGQNSCLKLPACGQSFSATLCKTAYEKYVNNGVYNARTIYTASQDGYSCQAEYQCDSSGPWAAITGADLKSAFGAVKPFGPGCGNCGDAKLSQSNNCWVRLIAAQGSLY